MLADRSEQHAGELAVATVSNHEQFGAMGRFDEHGCGVVFHDSGSHFDVWVGLTKSDQDLVEDLRGIRLRVPAPGEKAGTTRSGQATPKS